MLNCPLCAKVFKARGNLNNHLISHTREKPHKCSTCSASFGHSASLKKHIKVVHEGIKIRRVIQQNNYKCPECSYTSSERAHLKCHMLTHSTELPFLCTIPGCDFKTKYETSLPQHVLRIHSDERAHECTSEGCNYKTNCKSNLTRHLKVHSTDKPFVCKLPGCNYKCKLKSSLELHNDRVHSQEKPFKCSVCEFRSKYKARLRHHEDEHENIKRFRCTAPKCSYASNSNHLINLHFSRKHTSKDLMCTKPGCHFRCATSALLKKHIHYKHTLPILKCPDDSCNFGTRKPWDMRSHISRRHKELDDVTARSKPHTAGQTGAVDSLICPFYSCNYETEFPHRYDRHVRTHDEEKQQQMCKLCSYRTARFEDLQKHIQSHTGERPYKCSYCDYAALCARNLQLHAGRIHNIHVIPVGQKHGQLSNCRTCSREFRSHNEFVLHSMTHLMAVVVLERLKLQEM